MPSTRPPGRPLSGLQISYTWGRRGLSVHAMVELTGWS